ncbi:MAG: QueT transporter family protein [Clostridiales bacterium]|jgi:uncharacterized membrane protein|nr:QueT transporter family protein [Clostridiales bacterium]
MNKTSRLTRGALIGAAYAALTLALPFIGFGPVQFRAGEALTVLPFIYPEAVWGLTAGCFVANFIGMALGFTTPWDILLGTLATLIAAYATSRVKSPWLAPAPPVIANAVIIGAMLTFVVIPGFAHAPLYYNILTIGISQATVCYLAGIPLLFFIRRFNKQNGSTDKNES